MRHLRLVPSWLRFLMILLLVMCILFRFINIDRKVYSLEETFTSLRISGYKLAEVKEQLFNGEVITRDSFIEYQNPHVDKDLSNTVMSLALESPERSPLYYVIARLWVQVFGGSIAAIRYLSALLSLLALPCIYWLCRELFNVSSLLPSLAIALVANAPINLVYAQEAREYMLWFVTTTLASTALLRALRLESEQKSDPFTTWGIYVITLALSLYTCLWTVFVAIAHGVYVGLMGQLRLTATVRSYFIATICSFFAFFPWLMIVIANIFQFLLSSDPNNSEDITLIPLVNFCLIQLSRIFFDLDIRLDNYISYIISLAFLVLFIYAIYFCFSNTTERIRLFILTLIIVPALPIILPGISAGGIRPGLEAYLMPTYLGLQISVTYLLATRIYNANLSRRRFWQFTLGLLIISGLVSCRVYYETYTWWNKGVSYGNPQIASFINQKSRPLLITNFSEINYGNVVSLSYLLESKVRFQLIPDETLPQIPNGFTDIFLLNPTNAWRARIAARYQLKPNLVYGDDNYLVWKLVQAPGLPRRTLDLGNSPP